MPNQTNPNNQTNERLSIEPIDELAVTQQLATSPAPAPQPAAPQALPPLKEAPLTRKPRTKHTFTILMVIALLFVGYVFVFPFIKQQTNPQFIALKNQGVPAEKVRSGVLTSGRPFTYIYLEKINTENAQRTLAFVDSPASDIKKGTSIRILTRTPEGDEKGVIDGRAGYMQLQPHLSKFISLVEANGPILNSWSFYDDGLFAALTYTEQYQASEDAKIGSSDTELNSSSIYFNLQPSASPQAVASFMQQLWAYDKWHAYTNVRYRGETFNASSIDGKTNDVVLTGGLLEKYKADILKRIGETTS